MISTNNKIHNENTASTRSLAGSERFFLYFICLARARTNEPAVNLLRQSRHVEIDSAGSRLVEDRVANLVAAGLNNGMWP